MAALPARRSGTPGLRSQKLLQIFKRPGILGKRIPLWFLSCLFRLAHCSWYVASVERMIFAMPVRSVPDAKSPQGACVCVYCGFQSAVLSCCRSPIGATLAFR